MLARSLLELQANRASQVFHEGLKSWSCCNEVNKPVLDFDDFLKISVSNQPFSRSAC
jgi:hypothetical protein